MKTLIVNLPQAADRRRYIEDELEAAGMTDFEFVDGVVAADLSQEEIAEDFDSEKARRYSRFLRCEMSAAEIGCAIAHRNVWRKIVSINAPCLVMEDDVELHPGFTKWVDSLPEMFDESEPWIVLAANTPVAKPKVEKEGHYPLYKLLSGWGTFCYIISPSAASLLLSKKAFSTADSWSEYIKQGASVYTGFHLPIRHVDEFAEKIGKRGWDKNWPLYKKIVVATRNEFFYKFWWPIVRRAKISDFQ